MLSVTLLASCELGGSMAVRPTAENAVKTPPTYKEALKRRKVRKKNADWHQAAFTNLRESGTCEISTHRRTQASCPLFQTSH